MPIADPWVMTAWATEDGYRSRASYRGVQVLGSERQTRLDAIADALSQLDLLQRREQDTQETEVKP